MINKVEVAKYLGYRDKNVILVKMLMGASIKGNNTQIFACSIQSGILAC